MNTPGRTRTDFEGGRSRDGREKADVKTDPIRGDTSRPGTVGDGDWVFSTDTVPLYSHLKPSLSFPGFLVCLSPVSLRPPP